ncbi:MAG: FtsX-like permease family protein, partial [Gemmatimonadaceae bacterium]
VAAGVTMGSARAELDAIGRRLAAQYPATDGGWRLRASTMDEWRNDGAGTFFLTLLGAVGFVLLIACANLATLLLARVTGRRKELALRSALGAPRARLVRQMVTETMVLALVAGALGLALSYLGVRVAVAGLPAGEVPYWITFGLDARVFSFAIAAAIVTGLVCSVGPALQASAPDIQGALNVGGRGATEAPRASRMRAVFVVAEIALALLLFTGAGLMIRAFLSLQHADMGFDTSHLLTASIEPKEGAYDDPARRRVLLAEMMERVERLPGVQAAAGSEVGPGARVEVEGRPAAGDGSAASVTRWTVTRGYFRAMRIPVVAGRDFAPDDRAGAPAVAIVNAEMARRLWTNESALGKRLRVAGTDAARPWVTVIGVVGNTRRNPLDPELEALLYMPFPQQVPRTLDIALRTPGDPLALVRALESAVHAVDADQPVVRVRTMEQRLAAWTWPVRFFATCLAAFAAFALFLAALGIYGVVAYATRQRTREIGLRVALGATHRDVVGLVLSHGARLTAAGLAIGVAGAYAVARLLASLPLGVRDTSPLMLLALAALFGGVALFASYLPARHALRIDPMVALRNE